MRLKTLTILLLISTLPLAAGKAQVKKLSQRAKISLLTCGPGEAVWSKFGHSALWVFDPQVGIDRVYNYGTFEFYSNDFYFQFVKGTANYRLSITNYLNFHDEYEEENRFIKAQELNLTDAEKLILYKKLEDNYKPENRYYRYDFLFQNCSSLIRDIVWEATSGRYSIAEESEPRHSYRSMMVPYLSPSPWLMQGEFILLGYKTDHDATPWDQMYLPDFMFNWFDLALNSEGESLVRNTQTMFLPKGDESKKSFLTHPNFILPVILLLTMVLTYLEIKRRKNFWFIDSFIFLISGLLGILMIFTWTSSLHLVLHQNMNLVWAFPFHLLLAFTIWIKRANKIVRTYARIMAPITLLFVLFFWLLPQAIPFSAVFTSGIILIRLLRRAEYPILSKID